MRYLRSLLFLFSSLPGCVTGSGPPDLASTGDAITGPAVTVTSVLANELDLSWTAQANASAYFVYMGPSGSEPAFWQTVKSPATTAVAMGIAGGATDCFAVRTRFSDGSTSEPSNVPCGTAMAGDVPVPQQPCVDTSTTTQIYQCESSAQAQCANLGFGTDDFCFEAFAQSCSCHDTLTAQATCAHHPEIAHNINADGSCSLVWR